MEIDENFLRSTPQLSAAQRKQDKKIKDKKIAVWSVVAERR
jgi:hypothetical protein